MFIRGEHIELKAIEPSDYARIQAILGAPSIEACLFGYPAKAAVTGLKAWVAKASLNKNDFYFAVHDADSAQTVGICAYQDIDYRNGCVTIWAAVAPGCGCGASILKVLARNAFDQLRMEHVALLCMPNDITLNDAAQEAGFRRDAILFSRIQKGNKRSDLLLYTRLKEEGDAQHG